MRRLLVLYGLAMSSVVLVAFLVPLGLLARSLAQDAALDDARQDAQGVALFAGGATQDPALLEATVLAANEGPRRTTVYLPDGTVVGEPAARSPAVELAALGTALVARADDGAEVVLPVGSAAGVAVVRTFVPDDELTRGVGQSWLILVGVGVVLLVGTAVAGDRIAARLSRSVLELSDVADSLGAGDLSARVEPSGPPEVASVGRVLNGLGARVAALVASEREMVADLSHRLRTPITALRLDVDSLADGEERARMAAHVDELVDAVDAVVRSARHPTGEASGRCDAAQVVRERAVFWEVLAGDGGRRLHLDVPDDALTVGLTASALGAALDVLVDNVFSHTPDGTPFALSARRGAGGVVHVAVQDDGPGLADPALVERGRSGAGSTGLGLDVARRTAEGAGGRLLVGAGPAGGARVVLELPAA
jgi:signal transduction histidine kinase